MSAILTVDLTDNYLDMVEDDMGANPETLPQAEKDKLCGYLSELLDVIGQDPVTFADQIARACANRQTLGCGSHWACDGGEQ